MPYTHRRLLSSMTADELAVERTKCANAVGKAARKRFMDILNEELRREEQCRDQVATALAKDKIAGMRMEG